MLICCSKKSTNTTPTCGSSTLDGPEEDTELERESQFTTPETSSTPFTMVESTNLNSQLCQFSTSHIQLPLRELAPKSSTQSTPGKTNKNTPKLLNKLPTCSTRTSRNTTILPQMLSNQVLHKCDDSCFIIFDIILLKHIS